MILVEFRWKIIVLEIANFMLAKNVNCFLIHCKLPVNRYHAQSIAIIHYHHNTLFIIISRIEWHYNTINDRIYHLVKIPLNLLLSH